MTHSCLDGRRIMLVEDEMLIAMMVELALCDEGCVVVGPYGRLDEAVAAARTVTVDAALLDINLAGERVFPVAEVLAARGVPFILVTGYGHDLLPPGGKHWPVCAKPFKLSEVIDMLDGLIRHPQPHI